MQRLRLAQLKQVAGGVCTMQYEITANATFLPFIVQYLPLIQANQITPSQFLQALINAGLNPNNLVFEVTMTC